MEFFLVGLGLVLVFEGLVLALLPKRLDDLLAALNQMPVDTRRVLGLATLAVGVFIIWLSRG